MKISRFSVLLLLVLYVGFAASIAWAAVRLPAQVATHFNASGMPNGWMSRSTHLVTMSVFGFAFPLFFIVICWSVRFLPGSLVNIPHREYWLTPEHREESALFLLRHSVWLACLASGFVTGLNVIMVFGNQRQPVELPFVWAMLMIGPFICSLAVWAILLYRHFKLPEPQPSSNG